MIAAGRLDRQVRIELASKAREAQGRELVFTWPPAGGVLLGEVWAEKLEETGREIYTAQQRVAEITAGWRIRWTQGLAKVTPTEEYRVVDAAGRAYDIAEVREEGRREALLIFGKARAE